LTIYEMVTGHQPYPGMSDEEISARYADGNFPDTRSLRPPGVIIKRCWRGDFYEASQIASSLLKAEIAAL
jgi:hypothetical protein